METRQIKLRFATKTEAYTYALNELTKLLQMGIHQDLIKQSIKDIQISFLNHEPDVTKVSGVLYNLANQLKEKGVATNLDDLAKAIEGSPYQNLSQQEKFENLLRRRFESTLFIKLLLQPTTKMMEAVGIVSQQILKTLKDIKDNNPELYQELILDEDGFLHSLNAKKNIIACGAFDHTPSEEEISNLLLENNPDKLPEIMHLHFKFASNVYRKIPLRLVPAHEPEGKFKDIVEEYYGNWEEFYFQIQTESNEGREARGLISDTCLSESELYTQENGSRGRFGEMIKNRTTVLGLLLESQATFGLDLQHYGVPWVPDAKGQLPNLFSQYVRSANDLEALYISGPSGMTALLLGLSEVLVNMQTILLKQQYLEAISAYIVGAGFHSLNEVIGPAEWALSLVPNYKVAIPGKEPPVPPHYAVFFEKLISIDPEFSKILDEAWREYLTFFEKVFLVDKKMKTQAKSGSVFFEENETNLNQNPIKRHEDTSFENFQNTILQLLAANATEKIYTNFILEVTKTQTLYDLSKVLDRYILTLGQQKPQPIELDSLRDIQVSLNGTMGNKAKKSKLKKI